MNCADVDILLAEYIEGSLSAEQRSAVETHLSGCRACAALAEDSAAAFSFLERIPMVEAPPVLVNKLLFEVANGASRSAMKPSLIRRILGAWSEPILQPRFAMGMAMTMLSIAMLFRVAGIQERPLTSADLDPVKVWNAAETRVSRWWSRGLQYYENLRVVYEIQSRIQEWGQDQPASTTNQPVQQPDGEKK
jgi:anti-sigma factor RsiW